jgi:hypothetical protein
MSRSLCLLLAAVLFASRAAAADLAKIDRTIKEEPAYSGKPKYGLLVFGPHAADRVWLVQDGNVLYVDRNGNGNLTEPGKKVAAKEDKSYDANEYGLFFEAGELKVGGKVHKHLTVGFPRLKVYSSLKDNPFIREALKVDAQASAARISVEVESARLKGNGIGGRLVQLAGFYDPTGILQFADKPAEAPIIHFDGACHIAFYGELPTLRLGRDNDLVLVVGTPGLGGGTFAMLGYDKAIPDGLYPKVDVRFPAAQEGGDRLKEVYELKGRC